MGTSAFRYVLLLRRLTTEAYLGEIRITEDKSTLPLFILIVGESVARNHRSLYNYSLQTTPYMSALQSEGSFYVFSDVLSPNALTDVALSKIMTFYRTGASGMW